ncbi:hypothetical protein PUNSTDRAFT_46619 [Punctularia strigosozonata HHB-11173 SS5]|uniref:uncharacterized protein n=1 Tax=Punctularia strigosozonata (strain HHB-11173) TaxID=741275 RepID=UPI0004417CED|nr:uncharacterized protein PUNSTDRAFT_46619 [Punctularia strigosozonata HHB-11173 SS5]EIN05761.1 hypothetical protein PUNSTDRAFT_46619 [Punctularia strigosozonata HHB-11173 SS5]
MWTLIGTYNYHLYSGDDAWLSTIWANYTKAVAYVESKVDSSELMNVTGLRDWARSAALTNSAELASSVPVLNASELGEKWAANATALKAAFNGAFWDEGQGMYVDNTTTTLAPQDANSFAVLFNVTDGEEKKALVSARLERNWNELGPVAPELPDTISPFIGGFEVRVWYRAPSRVSGMPSSSLAGGFSGPGSPAVARSAGRSAWSMGSPFQRPASVAGSPESMRGLPARAIDGASSSQGGMSLLFTTRPAAANEDEDEELKFVLELSLAESRSRREVV